jgi:hypothetical protein
MNATVNNLMAAIIGYWRSGAKHYDISQITDLSMQEVEEIIFNYTTKNQTWIKNQPSNIGAL